MTFHNFENIGFIRWLFFKEDNWCLNAYIELLKTPAKFSVKTRSL